MDSLIHDIATVPEFVATGRVKSLRGLMVHVNGPLHLMPVGSHLRLTRRGQPDIPAEVIGFEGDSAVCLAFRELDGISRGAKVTVETAREYVHPSAAWLGRVVNALGEPIDGKGPLPYGSEPYPVKGSPLPAAERARLGAPLDTGVRALNTFLTLCAGQRMGIFAGSGVGKSVLMSMLARHAKCDIAVIGLVGERGREVQEFIEDELGEEGLKRSVVVVATSDQAPLMRRRAAYMTMAISEFFRDQGKHVFCMMDSVTRFAYAQREIGLSSGEPPTTRGYTPTVFSELPKLLERAGPGRKGSGMITGLFSVLIDGDDHNEPVADAVRGILDGHIVMERAIAERGRYPAINVLKSVSRSLPAAADERFWPTVLEAKRFMAAYSDMEELIRLGAYRRGSDEIVDISIDLHDLFEGFLAQSKHEEPISMEQGYQRLTEILAQRA